MTIDKSEGSRTRKCAVCDPDESYIIHQEQFREIIGIDRPSYTHNVRICKNCGFVYVSPVVGDDELRDYYTYMSLYECATHNGSVQQERIYRYHSLFDFIHDYIKKNQLELSYVLDIGCSTGYLLSLFKKNGYNVLGVDPSPKCKEIALKKYGINLKTGAFDNITLQNEKYDVVILSHVLEHIVDLSGFVLKMRSILSTEGIVYIEVPDVHNINVPFGYFFFEHINYFSIASLTNLMTKFKFTLEEFGKSKNEKEGKYFPSVIYGIFKKSERSIGLVSRNDYEISMNSIQNYKIKEVTKRITEDFEEIFTRYHRIAFFGGGTHTSRILSLLKDEYFKKIKIIFDNDPKKNNTSLNEIKVSLPFTNKNKYKEVVDAIIISSLASEIEIYEQIKHLESEGIRVIRLYG